MDECLIQQTESIFKHMRGHSVFLASLLIGAALFLSGCGNEATETESPIVAFAEGRGSGNLRLATVSSIRVWARNQGGTAREILAKCKALRGVDATWQETTEGRLCLAVREESFWGFGGEGKP
jgi:hypothetical protein